MEHVSNEDGLRRREPKKNTYKIKKENFLTDERGETSGSRDK